MIKQSWNISSEEKYRIVNIHETATKKLYMINEQNTQKFDYFMTKDDGFNEETSGKALYFVKNGMIHTRWCFIFFSP